MNELESAVVTATLHWREQRSAWWQENSYEAHERAQNTAEKLGDVKAERDRLREALEDVKQHVEFNMRGEFRMSAIWNIADVALHPTEVALANRSKSVEGYPERRREDGAIVVAEVTP